MLAVKLANLVELRSDLATALAGAGRVIYAFPKEQFSVPALVLVPSSPYLVPSSIGGLGNRIDVRFDLTALVGATDNQAALANLENLMLEVFDVLPSGVSVNEWAQPTIQTIADKNYLTSQITIELVTTI